MRFTTGSLVSLGLAAVHGLPVPPAEISGCRVVLAPTLSQPQNAASNILFRKSTGHVHFQFAPRSILVSSAADFG
jgi:hypothetical protein